MRSIANLSPSITTEIKTPAEAQKALCDPGKNWLSELREMRGRVLYEEGGWNPMFVSESGTCTDLDSLDEGAHHVLVRAGDDIVACARVSVLNRERAGYVSSLLGSRRFEEILFQSGAAWGTTCEASRWIVDSKFRHMGLGPRVVAAAWTLARCLEMRAGFVLACTRYGQDRLLCRMGAKPVDGVPLIPAGVIHDELRLLHFNLCVPAHVTLKRMSARGPVPVADFINAGPSHLKVRQQTDSRFHYRD
jgi:predicted GNAT family N-acyltransferase